MRESLDWPNHIPYQRESFSKSLSIDDIRLLMFSPPDDKAHSSLIATRQVHPHIKVRNLGKFVPKHPLAKTTTLSGGENYGVFATQAIEQGEAIGEYVGNMEIYFSEEELHESPSFSRFSEYKWVVSHPHYFLLIDASEGGNELAMVNDYRGLRKSPNVQPAFIAHGGRYYFGFVAIEKIFAGDEVLSDYGDSFWNFHPQSSQN